MKNIFKYTLLALGGLLLTNCYDSDEIEVIKFDDSFTPANPVEKNRDTPPVVNLLDNIAFFKKGEITIPVDKENLDTNNIINGEVFTNRKMTENFEYQLELDQDWISSNPDLQAIPSGAFTISGQTLNKDERNGTFKIQLNTDMAKDFGGTYYLPLKLVSKNDNLNILKGYESGVFKLVFKKSYPIPEGDNVTGHKGYFFDGIGDKLPQVSLSFESNYKPDHLFKLNDGDQGGQNWWCDANESNTYLTTKFATNTIKALKIYTNKWNNTIKSAKVQVSKDNGATWVDQGVATFGEYATVATIEFTQPIDINAIKISNMTQGGGNYWLNINEIEVFKNPSEE
ncbi:DUF1735 domain-containing protein [Ornithobacterium rhinotracheale]|uniref:BT_3987 domain-containing protein n=1 Tax=Ornithobacterium rhinotracheale TaxID=28251 RepID=UPI00129CE537|nr:DUF1735 domain-containing protein [Ornithobacterium rhinotracheale]MRI64470.1 DUF1735 domain-containing protein [Ornithobacterium rhinotracheale]